MTRKLAPIYAAAWRGIVVLLIVEIAIVSLMRYVTGGDTPPPPVAANAFAYPFLVIHVVASVIALLVGPLQFVRLLRARLPAVHRATGYVYITACAIGSNAADRASPAPHRTRPARAWDSTATAAVTPTMTRLAVVADRAGSPTA